MSAIRQQALVSAGPARPRRLHHVVAHLLSPAGRHFVVCRAGCGRVQVDLFEHDDQARRYLDAVSKARGEHGRHGVMPAAAAKKRRRRAPKQREIFG